MLHTIGRGALSDLVLTVVMDFVVIIAVSNTYELQLYVTIGKSVH